MTATAASRSSASESSSRPSSVPGGAFDTIVAALTDGTFDRLALAVADDASLRALLPRGLREWEGSDAICEAFAGWFGGLDELDVLDSRCGRVGERVQMQWRLHARGERLGDGPRVVEQHVFAHLDAEGRIQSMSLLCSGFQVAPADG